MEAVILIVSKLLDIVLSLVPVEEARKQLSEAEARLANQSADVAEQIKFGASGL